MNEKDSKTIDKLRFPLAVMVVAIHSYITIDGWFYSEVANQGLGCNVAQFFMIAIGHVLTHIAVPTFFLISGYLFFQNFGDGKLDIWKRKLKSRVWSLIIPYILWILLFVLWKIALSYKTVPQGGMIDYLQSLVGVTTFWCSSTWNLDRVDIWGNPSVSSSPILVPFWFMRNLIVCVFLISPLFYFMFRKGTLKIVRNVGAILLAFLYFTQTSLYLPGLSSQTLFYFGIGAYLSLSDKSITETFSRHKYFIWILFGILFISEVALDGHNTIIGNIIYPFFVLAGVMFVINIISRKGITRGKQFTFFIFAFHVFILPFVSEMVLWLLCVITGESFANNVYYADRYPYLIVIEYCFIVAIDVVACMITYNFIQKISPKFCKVLCGR